MFITAAFGRPAVMGQNEAKTLTPWVLKCILTESAQAPSHVGLHQRIMLNGGTSQGMSQGIMAGADMVSEHRHYVNAW